MPPAQDKATKSGGDRSESAASQRYLSANALFLLPITVNCGQLCLVTLNFLAENK
jgi:hypothetical protein